MSYELNDFALLTEGVVSPVDGGDYCLAPFPLLTYGVIVLEVEADVGVSPTGMAKVNPYRKRILMEDEEIFLVLVAWLQVKDDD